MALQPAISMPPALRMPRASRKVVGSVATLLFLALAAWWLLALDQVEERVREEEVEMFDLAIPPPPPPPPEPMEQPEVTPDKVAEKADTVQLDPLSPPQPTSANPPAGDLSSLLQDPTSDSGSFTGGPRGQGGTGKGPLIGGTGGGAGASRAYAELVQRALMRHLRKRPDLAQAAFDFRVRVRVSGAGQLEVLGLSNVRPPDIADDLLQALRGLSRIETPPPAGVPNQITLQLNQA
jgi:periplasmic protein TonB